MKRDGIGAPDSGSGKRLTQYLQHRTQPTYLLLQGVVRFRAHSYLASKLNYRVVCLAGLADISFLAVRIVSGPGRDLREHEASVKISPQEFNRRSVEFVANGEKVAHGWLMHGSARVLPVRN